MAILELNTNTKVSEVITDFVKSKFKAEVKKTEKEAGRVVLTVELPFEAVIQICETLKAAKELEPNLDFKEHFIVS